MPDSLNTNTTWESIQSSKLNMSALGNRDYAYFLDDWRQLLDTVEGGEREVKERSITYLPKTSGQASNTECGDEIYDAYKKRSIFYGYSRDTLVAMLGVMHAKSAKFQLPSSISELDKEAEHSEGWRVGLKQILREVNRNQLTYGRLGILVDMPPNGTPTLQAMPKLLMYQAFFILDWSTREMPNGDIILDYVLLAEESPREENLRTAKCDDNKIRLRVLALDADGNYYSHTIPLDDTDGFRKNARDLEKFDLDNPPEDAIYPIANDERMSFIPFVFINVTHLRPDIEKSPLMQLSNMDISIYRGDADWAQAYFLQGQATAVFTGVNEQSDKFYFGAGASIQLSDPEAKAYYLEVSGDGLGEMRERQTALQNFATLIGISLVDQHQAESGKALDTRVGIKCAPLATVAETGAKGLHQALRYALFWKTGDMDSTDLLVEPNKDFSTSTKAAKELIDLWTAKMSGAPISMRDVHTFAKDNDFTRKDYEETLADLSEEESTSIGMNNNNDQRSDSL